MPEPEAREIQEAALGQSALLAGRTQQEDATPHIHSTTDKASEPEKGSVNVEANAPPHAADIEHFEVQDDPRKWSSRKKWATFFFVCYTSMAATLSANIFLPAIEDLKADLGASQTVVNLAVSLFVLAQGTVPILWSAFSEIYGRKKIYIMSFSLFAVSQIACAVSTNGAMFVIFRIVGAAGSSSALSIGGGTLADIYEPHERGTRLGIYYVFPLFATTFGALVGGALTLTPPGWRAAFWFIAAYAGSCVLWAFFFVDTFRKERSLAWTAAFKRAEAAAKAKDAARKHLTDEAPRSRAGTRAPTPEPAGRDANQRGVTFDTEARPELARGLSGGIALQKVTTEDGEDIPVKVHLRDVNPLAAVGLVLRVPSNFFAMLASGLLFGATYSLSFTGALSFAAEPYDYNSLKVGLVLLAFGLGNIAGSVIGGRYSDIILRHRMKQHGKMVPEWRLRATFIAMPVLILTFVAFAWTVDKHVSIAPICVVLFFAGVSIIWIYSATLAYIVDSATGMASSAVSCNSAFRGISGFVASQSGEPLLTAIGNGLLYTIWSIILLFACLSLVMVAWKGEGWREKTAQKKEEKEEQARMEADAKQDETGA